MIPQTSDLHDWAKLQGRAIEDTGLVDHDWDLDGAILVRAFHGTTHAFEHFTLNRSHHDAHFGKVAYFTSSRDDASINYASTNGPDLLNRIERHAELIANEDPALDEDAATALARQHLVGGTPRVLDVLLRLDNPFVIDAAGYTHQPLFPQALSLEDAKQEYATTEGMSLDDIDAAWEAHEEAIYEIFDRAADRQYESVTQALSDAAVSLGLPVPEMPAFLDGLTDISCTEFERTLREADSIVYLEDDEGNLLSSSFISAMIEKLGFDSIVLLNAGDRFSAMNMRPGTTHVHLLETSLHKILISPSDIT